MANAFHVALASCFGLAATVPAFAAAATPSTITAIEILTQTVDVSAPVASPKIKLTTKGHANTIAFQYQGPSGEVVGQQFQVPEGVGDVAVLQAYLPSDLPFGTLGTYGVMFSPYSEPGVWKITNITICGPNLGDCSSYSQSQLAQSTFKIVNPHKFDIQAPLLDSGDILTPTVSLASGLPVKIKIHATDNVSGVRTLSVCASAPGVTSQLCVTAPLPLHVTLAGDFIATAVPPAGTPPGTYTITSLYLQDVAGNWNVITNPGSIVGAFSGGASFTVTP